eukprot:s52_g53.t1
MHSFTDQFLQFLIPGGDAIGRPLMLQPHVDEDRSLANIERTEVQRWPDLGQPLVQRRLIEVHPSISKSIYAAAEDYEIYLAEANIDTPIGRVPFLVETQCWDTAAGRFCGDLECTKMFQGMNTMLDLVSSI